MLRIGGKKCQNMRRLGIMVNKLIKEYKCISDNLIMYFVIANSLLKRFNSINVQHVPRIENQEAKDLAQVASRYKVSKKIMQ